MLWKEWLFVNGALLAIYYVWDHFWCYPRERPADVARDETRVHRLRFGGLWPNALLLLGVILSVGAARTRQADSRHRLASVALSAGGGAIGAGGPVAGAGQRHLRRANRFNYAAILEVAALFFGIFICMQPALQILAVEGPNLGLTRAVALLLGLRRPVVGARQRPDLRGILRDGEIAHRTARPDAGRGRRGGAPAGRPSASGSVFMGANTYIGNGPNFMVKAIAEKSGVAMPSFFGYMLYSGGILIPLFVL